MNGRGLSVIVVGLLVVSWSAQDAIGLNAFKKSFDEVYVRGSNDAKFKALFKRNHCNVCHVKGKKRDVVNAYGMELAKLIPGNAKQRIADAKKVGSDAKEAEEANVVNELKAALKKVEQVKLPCGGTYGEMLKARRLPLGEAVGSIAADKEEE